MSHGSSGIHEKKNGVKKIIQMVIYIIMAFIAIIVLRGWFKGCREPSNRTSTTEKIGGYRDTTFWTTPVTLEIGSGAEIHSCGRMKVYTPSTQRGRYNLTIHPGGNEIPNVCKGTRPTELFEFPERASGPIQFLSGENHQNYFMVVTLRYGKKR